MEEDRITDTMLQKMKKSFSKQISAVAISESAGTGTIDKNGDTASVSVSGVNKEHFQSDKVTLLAGRFIKKTDLDGSKHVIKVSDKLVETLYDEDNKGALWKKLSMNINENYQEDTSVSSVSSFAEQIETFFDQYYRNNEDYEIATSTTESMTESMSSMVQTVSLAISLIAGISLLVGGISSWVFSYGTGGSYYYGGSILDGCGSIFWILSGKQGGKAGSHRSITI